MSDYSYFLIEKEIRHLLAYFGNWFKSTLVTTSRRTLDVSVLGAADQGGWVTVRAPAKAWPKPGHKRHLMKD